MEEPYRLGLVATSRSGSTYFRRYLCDKYGLYDSASWLKHNPYERIHEAPFANKHHILKILTHYVPEQQIDGVILESEPIWLYRKDMMRQFLSHVTRIETKTNLVYKKEEVDFLNDSIPDNSLVATRKQYDTFMRRLEKFWDLYYTHNAGKLIQYEEFITDPEEIGYDIFEDYNLEWIMWEEDEAPPKVRLPLKIEIDYEKKFKNIDEIRKWFNE
tara:strand:+ start:850 stop:1494 length:645 start_codon:yes stop_codon:yes gene_type:complete